MNVNVPIVYEDFQSSFGELLKRQLVYYPSEKHPDISNLDIFQLSLPILAIILNIYKLLGTITTTTTYLKYYLHQQR